MEEVEKFFKCPFCMEKISMLIDTSTEGPQTYIEDCEVCCNPIELHVIFENEELVGFDAVNIEQ